MASNYSHPDGSVLQRLNSKHNQFADQLADLRRNVVSEATTLAIEMAEVQAQYLKELEAKIEQLTAKNREQEEKIAVYQFNERSRNVQELQERFPLKRRRR